MKDLNFQHLVHYLSHDLECHVMGEYTVETQFDDNPVPKVYTMTGLLNTTKVSLTFDKGKHLHHISDVFPILRPVTEIDDSHIRELRDLSDNSAWEQSWLDLLVEPDKVDFNQCPHHFMEQLCKWHFDVFKIYNDGE